HWSGGAEVLFIVLLIESEAAGPLWDRFRNRSHRTIGADFHNVHPSAQRVSPARPGQRHIGRHAASQTAQPCQWNVPDRPGTVYLYIHARTYWHVEATERGGDARRPYPPR